MRSVLSLDVGAGSTSGLLVEPVYGRVLARCSIDYPHVPSVPPTRDQVVEQRADLWTDAAVRVLNELTNTARVKGLDIAAVGVSGMVAGLGVPVDRDFTALRPVPLWQDRRGGSEASAAAERLDAGMLMDVTGNNGLSPYFGFIKLLWYMGSDTGRFLRTHALLTPAGLIVHMLTGEHVTDTCSLGAYGGVLDVERCQVSKEMLSELSRLGTELAGRDVELSPELFGRLVTPEEVAGNVSLAGAALAGLPENIPVVTTGLDITSAMVAAGARAPGDNVLLMGTSWILGVISERASMARPRGMVHTPAPFQGAMLAVSISADPYTGGAAGFWMPDLVTRASVADLEREAKMVPAGSSGVTFLPLLMGERAPLGAPGPGGAFMGLRAEHSRGHLFRAVLEGGAFLHEESLLEVMDADRNLGPTRLVDGTYPCPLWRSIVADVTGREVLWVPEFQGAAYGGAMLTSTTTGLVGEEMMYGWLTTPQVLSPTRNPDKVMAYNKARERFRYHRDLVSPRQA